MIFENIKILIESDNYEKQKLLNKIDLFFLKNRITEDEYNILLNMINNKEEF